MPIRPPQPVYYIPGYLSSTLANAANGNTIWMNPKNLAFGGMLGMALAADGVSPDPSTGMQLTVSGLLPPYSDQCIARLTYDLTPLGYTVIPYPWDWRYSLARTATALAAAIVQSGATPQSPAILVCHSAGGLVARLAYSALIVLGKADLVGRIITMGTPHYGTYYPVGILSGGPADLFNVVQLIRSVVQTFPAQPWTSLLFEGAVDAVIGVVASWPSFYELFPQLGAIAAQDIFRIVLYLASNWSTSPVPNQAWLNAARNGVQVTLAGGLSQIMKPGFLVTLAGNGYITPVKLQQPTALGDYGALALSYDGDGVVDTVSASGPNGANLLANWKHPDMPTLAAGSGWLTSMIVAPLTASPSAFGGSKVLTADTLGWSGPPVINLDQPNAQVGPTMSYAVATSAVDLALLAGIDPLQPRWWLIAGPPTGRYVQGRYNSLRHATRRSKFLFTASGLVAPVVYMYDGTTWYAITLLFRTP
jgi:hypothetical protein